MSLSDHILTSLVELGGRGVTTPALMNDLLRKNIIQDTGYDHKISITRALNRMRRWGTVDRVCKIGQHCFEWEIKIEQ